MIMAIKAVMAVRRTDQGLKSSGLLESQGFVPRARGLRLNLDFSDRTENFRPQQAGSSWCSIFEKRFATVVGHPQTIRATRSRISGFPHRTSPHPFVREFTGF